MASADSPTHSGPIADAIYVAPPVDLTLYNEIYTQVGNVAKPNSPVRPIGVKYDDRPELSITFSTPLEGNKMKTLLVYIRAAKIIPADYDKDMKAADYGCKINILGGLAQSHTIAVYNYLRAIFEYYWEVLIIDPHDIHDENVYEVIKISNGDLENNIKNTILPYADAIKYIHARDIMN
jgi:hypothetical protein